jgi:hypothetical protein
MNRAVRETPAAKSTRKKRARRGASRQALVAAFSLVAVLVASGVIGPALKGHAPVAPAPQSQRAPAYHADAEVAYFSYERRDDFGNRIESSIDCPGTQICVVEIRSDGAPIARSNLPWEVIEPFFTYFSTNPLAVTPKTGTSSPGGRELVRWRFKKGINHLEGAITDESRNRSVIPAWDAMILSFI